jgi:AcrR family transcriptional regulator
MLVLTTALEGDLREMSAPTGKHERVVERATDVFCRYGFARTTMGDVAERCKISRPALYLLFPDKEAIFTAVVEQMDREKHLAIRSELERAARQAAARLSIVGMPRN